MDEQMSMMLKVMGQMLDEKLAPVTVQLQTLSAGQAVLEAGQEKLEAGQAELKAGQDRVEGTLAGIREELDDMHNGINAMVAWLDRIDRNQTAV